MLVGFGYRGSSWIMRGVVARLWWASVGPAWLRWRQTRNPTQIVNLFFGAASQGVVCGDIQQGDCVFRDSEEHKKILMKRWQPQRQPFTTHYTRNTVALLSLFLTVDDSAHRSLEQQLLLAATKGDNAGLETVRDLIIQEVDLNTTTSEGKTPLHLSVHSGNTQVAKLIVEMCADVDKQDKEKRTPLHIACLNNHVEIARCLLEEGKANTYISDRGLKVPMHLACINGHTKVVDLPTLTLTSTLTLTLTLPLRQP